MKAKGWQESYTVLYEFPRNIKIRTIEKLLWRTAGIGCTTVTIRARKMIVGCRFNGTMYAILKSVLIKRMRIQHVEDEKNSTTDNYPNIKCINSHEVAVCREPCCVKFHQCQPELSYVDCPISKREIASDDITSDEVDVDNSVDFSNRNKHTLSAGKGSSIYRIWRVNRCKTIDHEDDDVHTSISLPLSPKWKLGVVW